MRAGTIGRVILAAIGVSPIVVGFMIWKRRRDAQMRARNILGPGEPKGITKVLNTLRKFQDSESTRLVQQLEERLRDVDREAWQEYQRSKAG